MNKISRIFAALLALLLLAASVPVAFAAGAETYAEAGDTVTLTVPFVGYGADGNVVVNDTDGIIENYDFKFILPNGSASEFVNPTTLAFSDAGATEGTYTLKVTVNLKSTAEAGKSCNVTFNYSVARADGSNDAMITTEKKVVVKAPETTPAPETTVPTPLPSPAPETTAPVPETTAPAPETTAPVVTSPITGTPSEPKPPVSSGSVDYTDLKKQISNAEGLEESKYTADSWKNLESALAAAKAALKSDKQSVVDDAAVALSSAIDALVAIDYSALEAAIERVNTFVEDNKVANKATKLMDALISATELLTSNDQKSIDEAAAQLNTLVDEIEDLINSLSVTETVIKEVEVEVEVEPQDDYCNIKIHYVWPVLFFISLALNLGFIALIVVFVVRRKKNQTDDTPLVDYDIDDAE